MSSVRGDMYVLCPVCQHGRVVDRRSAEYSLLTEVSYNSGKIGTSVHRAPIHHRVIACLACPASWPTVAALESAWRAAGAPRRTAS